MSSETRFLEELFRAAVEAADPARCIPGHLPAAPRGRTVVVGAGKASASMARAVEQNSSGEVCGLVITRYGHGADLRSIEVCEAGHPVPDQAGVTATRRIVGLVSTLDEEDLVLALISGGGSALLTLPAPGLSLEQKQAVNRALLKSGANIAEMNCVRKHLSAVKGGRLAGYCAPAALTCLMISDVPGDDPATIASGPTVPDPTTRGDALEIVDRYGVVLEPAVRAHLESPASETPKPGDAVFDRVTNLIVAAPGKSLERAAALALGRGIEATVLGDDLQGEARTLGREHARLALELERRRSAPIVVLSGGETTVTVTGSGRGGRNLEYLLGLAIELDGAPGIHALAADTDGIDGTEDNAGALVAPDTLHRARLLGLEPSAYLRNNDAYSFFQHLGDLLVTGPTLTNVNDFRAIYVAN